MGTHPFEDMPRVINRRAVEAGNSLTRIVRKAATVGGAAVVDETPVDTGKARSNWVASINGPIETTIPPYSPGMKLGRSERANANAALSQHQSAITRFDAEKHRAIHITNNVPYLTYLNTPPGSSAQTPALFVQRSVQAAIVAITGERIFKSR